MNGAAKSQADAVRSDSLEGSPLSRRAQPDAVRAAAEATGMPISSASEVDGVPVLVRVAEGPAIEPAASPKAFADIRRRLIADRPRLAAECAVARVDALLPEIDRVLFGLLCLPDYCREAGTTDAKADLDAAEKALRDGQSRLRRVRRKLEALR